MISFGGESERRPLRGQFRDQGDCFPPLRRRRHQGPPSADPRGAVLKDLSASLGKLYANEGRPSIPPEQVLSALLLQVFYAIRSERQPIERLDDNPGSLVCWPCPRLGCDDLHQEQRASAAGRRVLEIHDAASEPQPREAALVGRAFFGDGTLVEAFASQKSFTPKDGATGHSARTRPIRRAVSPARPMGARRSSASWATRRWRTGGRGPGHKGRGHGRTRRRASDAESQGQGSSHHGRRRQGL